MAEKERKKFEKETLELIEKISNTLLKLDSIVFPDDSIARIYHVINKSREGIVLSYHSKENSIIKGRDEEESYTICYS